MHDVKLIAMSLWGIFNRYLDLVILWALEQKWSFIIIIIIIIIIINFMLICHK